MKKHVIRLKSGEEVVIRETPNGAVCPVCGAIHRGGLSYDWFQSIGPDGALSEPFGAPSSNTCPSCGTKFGTDDAVEFGSIKAKWHELRMVWLDRVGWKDQAIQQLQQNLEINQAALRRLSPLQWFGVVIFTASALVLLWATPSFFIRHSHRVYELSGVKRWSFIVMLVLIALVGIWALGMIGAVLHLIAKTI